MRHKSTTASMSRTRAVMSMLTAVLLLSACSSDTVPTGTSLPSARPQVYTPPQFAPCSDEGRIDVQGSLDLLLSSGTQQAAFSQFAHVVRACVPNDPKTIDLAFKLLDFTLQRMKQGQIENPGAAEAERFLQLWANVYKFIGLGVPTLSVTDLGEALADGAIGVATPGQSLSLVANSGNFALKTDADFFVAPALVVMARRGDDFSTFCIGCAYTTAGGTLYQRYPPKYNITVSPASAQRNVPVVPTETSVPTSPSFAAIAVCPGDFHDEEEEVEHVHPDVDELRVARTYAGETEILALSSQAIMLLSCTEKGLYPGVSTISAAPAPTGFDLFASRARAVASRLGGALVSMVTPANLYAWDGGVGGRTADLNGDYEAAAPAGDSIEDSASGT